MYMYAEQMNIEFLGSDRRKVTLVLDMDHEAMVALHKWFSDQGVDINAGNQAVSPERGLTRDVAYLAGGELDPHSSRDGAWGIGGFSQGIGRSKRLGSEHPGAGSPKDSIPRLTHEGPGVQGHD